MPFFVGDQWSFLLNLEMKGLFPLKHSKMPNSLQSGSNSNFHYYQLFNLQ